MECVFCGEEGHSDCSEEVWAIEEKIGYQLIDPTLSNAREALEEFLDN